MERIFGLKKVARIPGAIVTLGVFDGVHMGHREVLSETVKWARAAGATSAVVTFDRHPEIVLRTTPAAALTSLEHRLALVEETGIDTAIVLHFDQALADMTAEDFIREILAGKIGVAGVLLGFNCRFGKSAQGDINLLTRLGEKYGFAVRSTEPLLIDGAPVSSTRIRNLISEGDLAGAARLLGRPVSLMGTVVHGDKRGRTLGFPTANLNLHNEVTPPAGVYVCRVMLDGGRLWGLVNIGFRPTFTDGAGEVKKTVEVYIDDYDPAERFYGHVMEIELDRFMRPEAKFDSAEALVEQMERDRRLLKAIRREAPGER